MTFATSKLKAFLPPAIFAMVGEFAIGLSDSVICGNMLGSDSLAAVNLLQGVLELISFVNLSIAIGTCILFATEIGAANIKRAKGYFTYGMILAIVAGIVIGALMLTIRLPVLRAFGASEGVFNAASEFWIWYIPCAIMQPLAAFLATLCYADGDTKLVFLSYVGSLACNLGVKIPMTMFYGMGGCALSEGMGSFCAIAILLFHFRKESCMLGYSNEYKITDVFSILKTSVGDASKNIGKAALLVVLNAFFISRFGSDNLSVLAVVIMTITVSEVFDGLSNAIQPLISVYVGEKNTFLTRRVMRYAVRFSLAQGFIISLVLAVYPQLMLKLAGISDPALVVPAVAAVRLTAFVLLGFAIVLLFNSYYVFIGRVILSTALTILAMCIFPIIASLAGGAIGGINGMCVGLTISPFAAVALVGLYLVLKNGVKLFPLLISPDREKNVRVFDLELTPENICEASRNIESCIKECGLDKDNRAGKAALLVEETLMVVRERNAGKKVLCEITIDFNDESLHMTMRDDGVIFNLTDADAQISSLRVYLVSNLMLEINNRLNIIATGFNRNTFKL